MPVRTMRRLAAIPAQRGAAIEDRRDTVTRPKKDISQWAAQFLRMYQENAAVAPEPPDARYGGVTKAARELLLAIDAGGVPAFVTGKLKQIAQDNGIEVADHWTPNQIVDALRAKAVSTAAPSSDQPGA